MQNQCTILCIFIFLFLAICILPFTQREGIPNLQRRIQEMEEIHSSLGRNHISICYNIQREIRSLSNETIPNEYKNGLKKWIKENGSLHKV